MKKAILLLLGVAIAGTLSAQQKNFIDQPYIELEGTAKMEVAPNQIFMNIILTEAPTKGKFTIEQQKTALYEALRAMNVDIDGVLKVKGAFTDLVRRKTIGANQQYELELSSVAQVEELMERLTAAEISQVSVDRTGLSNLEELQEQVRLEAAANGRKLAEALAATQGITLGRTLMIRDNGFPGSNYYGRSEVMYSSAIMMDEEMAGTSPKRAPQLEFEKITIEHSVYLTIALE